jgi:hypothetical protein
MQRAGLVVFDRGDAAAPAVGRKCIPAPPFGALSPGAGAGCRACAYLPRVRIGDQGMSSCRSAHAHARRALLVAGVLAPFAPALAQTPGEAAGPGVLALFGGSGDRIEGSGKVVDDVRDVAGFSRLVLQGPLDVRVQAADRDGVVVHADDNIAPLIETTVRDGALVIGLRPGASYRTHAKIRVRVQARQLQGVVLRGSGEVRADRIETDVFEATLQGSGDIAVELLRAGAVAVSLAGNGDFRAKGTARSLGVVIEGSGDVHCADLVAQQVAVRINGSGDARVNATGELKVDVSGSGDVRYRGEPKITKSILGSGSVAPLR